MYVCMHACMYVCMHACMYACMYVCMHACMHVRMYVCMYICMHVCTQELQRVPPTTQKCGHSGNWFGAQTLQGHLAKVDIGGWGQVGGRSEEVLLELGVQLERCV